ncbi:MAG: ABC transporter permease, partial [Chloroflexota bacterium]
MTGYIVRRIISMIVVLFAVSLLTFFFMQLIPGSPFDGEKNIPPAVIRQLEAKYNLDQPVWRQYVSYMEDLVVPRITGEVVPPRPNGVVEDYLINIPIIGTDNVIRWMNFGPSYRSSSQSVNDIFERHLPISFQLGLAAMIVALTIGIPTGIAAGLRRNSWVDYASMSIALLGVSVPAIVSGPILRYVFGVQLQWLPPTGWGTFEHV